MIKKKQLHTHNKQKQNKKLRIRQIIVQRVKDRKYKTGTSNTLQLINYPKIENKTEQNTIEDKKNEN